MATKKRAAKTADDVEEKGEDGHVQQFVTFFLGEECFAFRMESVLEIIRVPDVVKVPLTPSTYVGLANLRGAILPIMDLRSMLSLDGREVDDASRTIVVDCGRAVGLVVDRVSRVVSFTADRIESPDNQGTLGDSVREGVLSGVVKDDDGAGLIQILEPRIAVDTHSLDVTARADETSKTARDADPAAAMGAEEEDKETQQLVNLLIDGQEYAFEISEVDEIVRPPDTIFQVPQAEPHVLGMINLRSRLLPIVSLRRMFKLPDMELDETNRILVVRLDQDQQTDARVGIVVDHVREVLNIPMTSLVGTSKLISDNDMDRISSMCRLDEGRRLIAVLTTRSLFQGNVISDLIEQAAAESEIQEGDSMTDRHDDDEDGDETQIVVYQLADQEYGVEISSVQEIIRVPDTLKRVPKAPGYVAGVINLRGSVLPVVSMRKRFDIEDADDSDRRRIIVLNSNGVHSGFIVDSVTEVLRLPRSAIETSPELSEEQSQMVGSVANLENGQRMIQILSAASLLVGPEIEELSSEAA